MTTSARSFLSYSDSDRFTSLWRNVCRFRKTLFVAWLSSCANLTAHAQVTSILTTIYSFTNGTDGNDPGVSLVQGSDGNFYGTTDGGGPNNDGTVFRITSSGELTTLCNFNGPNGASSDCALVQSSNGNFYGTTYLGGANGYGTVFQFVLPSALTVLHSFALSDEPLPFSLVQGSDGNFYGTSRSYTDYTDGSVFKITSTGEYTVLHSFSGNDGSGAGKLIEGSDGNFYSITGIGGIIRLYRM